MRGLLVALMCAWPIAHAAMAQPIDRAALVARHAIEQVDIDRHAPVTLGNGSLGFTADITGLQTFPERYAPQSPLLTMAQWAWHSFPNPHGYGEADGMVSVPVPGRGERPYAHMRDFAEMEARPALRWLRENPHRFSLGRVALVLRGCDGAPARFEAIGDTRQRLDLWTGILISRFRYDGADVAVETFVDPARDMVRVRIVSPLVASGRLGVEVRYPGVSRTLNPDPSDWAADAAHRTRVVRQRDDMVVLARTLDDTRYHAMIAAPGGRVRPAGAHRFAATAQGRDTLVVAASFEREASPHGHTDHDAARSAVREHWRRYWTQGGVIDFSGSTDPRATELERRVVLSQYLAAIHQAGTVPPQEEGLFSNSWNGKFHLEMHGWHAAHFAAWGRPALLARSIDWYRGHLPAAMARAARMGTRGAWWPKMVGPDGRESPSPINPFIMWQQPHPIYLAELLFRADPTAETIERLAPLVEQTAQGLASWPLDRGGRRSLGPPVIPVQENHPPMTTADPAFELAYYRWALGVAQHWRERRGIAREPVFDTVRDALAPLPAADGLYLPAATAPDFWRTAIRPGCSRHAIAPECLNRDHPSMLMAHGLIGGDRVNRATMRRTLDAVERHWDLRQTWGWDFPMAAMTAARLGDGEGAVRWLFADAANNRWGRTGMTPRLELAEDGDGAEEGGYRRIADTYFPSNGALLLAAGMMAAGWDGSTGDAPGFPRHGWRVRSEGIVPLP